jgi:hypothetical protein
MKAFVCEFDDRGIGHVLPNDLLLFEELSNLTRSTNRRPSAFVWALLDDSDTEDLRSEVGPGRSYTACKGRE